MGNDYGTAMKGRLSPGPISVGPPPAKRLSTKRGCPFICKHVCTRPAPQAIFCDAGRLKGRFEKVARSYLLRPVVDLGGAGCGRSAEDFFGGDGNPGSGGGGGNPESLASWSERNLQLALFLRGAGLPLKRRRGFRPASCGSSRNGEGAFMPMQLFSPTEMRNYLGKVNLSRSVSSMQRMWVSTSPGGTPIGLVDTQVELLCAMAALEMGSWNSESPSLKVLMEDGGAQAVFAIAHMAGEPTIGLKARARFVHALEGMASCASIRGGPESFSSSCLDRGKTRINNPNLAGKLSRFMAPPPEWAESGEVFISQPKHSGNEIEGGNLMDLLFLATEGLIAACVKMSSRLWEISMGGGAALAAYGEEIVSFRSGLRAGVRSLLGNKRILGMLASCCHFPEKGIVPGAPELGALRETVFAMEGELHDGSVRSIRRLFGWEQDARLWAGWNIDGKGEKGGGGSGDEGA